MTASVRQALTRCPSSRIVQAPQAPWSQPFFVPWSERCSRSTSSSDVLGSSERWYNWPLTVRSISEVSISSLQSSFRCAGVPRGTSAKWQGHTGELVAQYSQSESEAQHLNFFQGC